jgi:hypothetical protein
MKHIDQKLWHVSQHEPIKFRPHSIIVNDTNWQNYISGHYYWSPDVTHGATLATTTTLSNTKISLAPLLVPFYSKWDGLALNLTTTVSDAILRMGIWNVKSNGEAGTLFAQTNEIVLSVGTGLQYADFEDGTITLPSGFYYIAAACSLTGVSVTSLTRNDMRCLGAFTLTGVEQATRLIYTNTYSGGGDLPDLTNSSPTYATTVAHLIGLKAA